MRGDHSIALIFFSREAEAEGIAKAWLRGARASSNTAIARLLIAKAQQNLRHAGLDIFHFHEGRQRGATFGQRFANAFADVFAMGYAAAIAVGNDSPEMEHADWGSLREAMASGHHVLGPTFRGGAYLIGMQAVAFDAATFAALPWQTTRIHAALATYLATASHSLHALPRLRDLNTLHDLRVFLRAHHDTFARQLARQLSAAKSPSTSTKDHLSVQLSLALLLRGPPRAA